MRFGYLILALSVVALSAMPAFAHDVVFVAGTGESIGAVQYDRDLLLETNSHDDLDGVADQISDPLMQDSVATTIERVSENVMRLPVRRFADAIEQARPGTVDDRLPHDATIGDLAGRNAVYLPQELGDRSREMIGMMGGFAKALAAMMPEIDRLGHEMDENFRAAKAEARHNRN